MRRFYTLVMIALLLVAVIAGYQIIRGRIAQHIYRERLFQLSRDYKQLRDTYNTAIRKSAVTELLVKDGKLDVVIMSSAGELKRIETPYDPRQEIHVDFVVLEGRLWIRRIHDSQTPASKALTINPELVNVSWDNEGEIYGIAIYRPLAEGRWVVSTTTNGALTLTRKEGDSDIRLFKAPEVREFEQIQEAVVAEVDAISLVDVVAALIQYREP